MDHLIQEEIEKLNKSIKEMSDLDISNFLENNTKRYHDISQAIDKEKKEVFNLVLVLKYKIFLLEESKKKWIVYSFFVTVILLGIVITLLQF